MLFRNLFQAKGVVTILKKASVIKALILILSFYLSMFYKTYLQSYIGMLQ